MSDKKLTPAAAELRKMLIIATVILSVAAIAQQTMVIMGGYVIAKDEVPLKFAIDEFPDKISDRFILARDINAEGVQGGKIQLTSDVVETLGTEDFITWIYRDHKNSTQKRQIFVRFHMAYYTALLDAVPHVADNCMVAGGMLADNDNSGEVTWTLDNAPDKWQQWQSVDIRKSSFVSARDPENSTTVFYVFSANGEPMWDRTSVRMAVSSPFERYCYYMKLEMTAFAIGDTLGPQEIEDICRSFYQDVADDVFSMLCSSEELKQMEDQDKGK